MTERKDSGHGATRILTWRTEDKKSTSHILNEVLCNYENNQEDYVSICISAYYVLLNVKIQDVNMYMHNSKQVK